MGIDLNTCSEEEHIPEMEQHNHTIKELIWATYNLIPFEKLPTLIIAKLVYNKNGWLNAFPHKNGISTHLSPTTIFTGCKINHNSHCHVKIRTYVQVQNQHSNKMWSRTTGAIALFPTGNQQGGYYFLSIRTGKWIF